MSIDEPVSTRGTTGAGLYGLEDLRRVHKCGACFNPFLRDGNPECKNAPKPWWMQDEEKNGD